MRLIFGPLEPDKPEHLQKGLQEADNVYPSPDGYRPIKAFDAMTPALAAEFQGGASFLGSDSTVQMLAGTATDLYRFNSSLEWSSILGSLTAGRWYFTQFNDFAIATHGGAPVEIDILNGTAQALGGSPPTSSLCTTVRDFVVLAAAATVTWSGFQDREEWTAGENQSGSQPLPTGGAITGLAGGEFGLVFQRSRITRMSYVGVPTVWQWDEISANIGCVSPGSLVQVGSESFFLSDKGFMKTDGTSVVPIGAERIDRTFLTTYTQDDIDDFMYASVDPKNHLVAWAMPGTLWIYNYILDQWSTSNQDIRAVFNGFTAGVTLDGLDAIYPDLDDMTPSLDDPEFMGGLPLFLAVNASNEIGTLQGDNLEASFELPNMEMIPARTTRITKVRPMTDATSGVTVRITGRQRLGDGGTTSAFSTLQDSGDIDCRISGRYLRPVVKIAAGTSWTFCQGLDFNLMAAGGRR